MGGVEGGVEGEKVDLECQFLLPGLTLEMPLQMRQRRTRNCKLWQLKVELKIAF